MTGWVRSVTPPRATRWRSSSGQTPGGPAQGSGEKEETKFNFILCINCMGLVSTTVGMKYYCTVHVFANKRALYSFYPEYFPKCLTSGDLMRRKMQIENIA